MKICEIPFTDISSPLKVLNELVIKARLIAEGFDLEKPIIAYDDPVRMVKVFKQK
jgi:hypothetical protein